MKKKRKLFQCLFIIPIIYSYAYLYRRGLLEVDGVICKDGK